MKEKQVGMLASQVHEFKKMLRGKDGFNEQELACMAEFEKQLELMMGVTERDESDGGSEELIRKTLAS